MHEPAVVSTPSPVPTIVRVPRMRMRIVRLMPAWIPGVMTVNTGASDAGSVDGNVWKVLSAGPMGRMSTTFSSLPRRESITLSVL